MRFITPILTVLIFFGGAAGSLHPQDVIPPVVRPNQEPDDVKLPNGKSQRDEILKADHNKNLEDADALIKLGQDLKSSLEKNGSFVVSVADVKKTEEIEKLAKRIRSRMKRL